MLSQTEKDRHYQFHSYVLQKAALFNEADSARRPGGIEGAAQLVRPAVKIVVVTAFVYSDAPEDHGGVVPVLEHHLAHVFNGAQLPFLAAYMLPAGDLRKHEEPQFVARIDEVLALGVVARPHGVAAELPLQYPRVLILHAVVRLSPSSEKRASACFFKSSSTRRVTFTFFILSPPYIYYMICKGNVNIIMCNAHNNTLLNDILLLLHR